MAAVRMNITLPEETAQKLKKRVAPRERSQVIAEALEMYFQANRKTLLVRELTKAYEARASEKSSDDDLWDSTVADGTDDEAW